MFMMSIMMIMRVLMINQKMFVPMAVLLINHENRSGNDQRKNDQNHEGGISRKSKKERVTPAKGAVLNSALVLAAPKPRNAQIYNTIPRP